MSTFYYIEKKELNWRFLAWALVAFGIGAALFAGGRGKLDYAFSGLLFAAGLLLFYLADKCARIKKIPLRWEKEELAEEAEH